MTRLALPVAAMLGVCSIIRAQPAQLEIRKVDDAMNTPLFVTGTATLVISYAVAAGVAASTDRESNNRLVIPIAGPFLALHERESCDRLTITCDRELTSKVLLAVDGAFQIAGVIGIIDAFVEPTHHDEVRLVYDTQIHVRPMTVANGPGLGIAGRF